MKKFWNGIKKDLWIVLLDLVAVNAAYFLALVIRFFVNSRMRPIASEEYIPAFLRFAPFYSVLCIAVFILWRLYGGMWRYAGINDMNRILGASLVTAVIQVVGTAVFVRRMPITYYVIGAVLQFLFISLIRFAYRILLVEKKKVAERKTSTVPAMVIGAGETARKAIRHLEDTPFRATVAADRKSSGQTLDGVPVVADYTEALDRVRAVFIADGNLSAEERKQIREKCEAAGVELQDYTGYLNNLGGKIPVSGLLELVKGPVTLVTDGKEQTYASGEEALKALKDRVEITSVEGLKLELKKSVSGAYLGYEAWAQQHKEATGEDVSFF